MLKFARVFKTVVAHRFRRPVHHLSSAKYAQTLLNLPETKVSELQNGFKVASQQADSLTSTVGVWIDAGSRYETAETNGVANFFEHLAFKSAASKSRQELEEKIGKIGAQFTSYTDREETAFYVKCLPGDVPDVVEILGEVLLNPSLDEQKVEEERKFILQELAEAENDLKQVTFDYLHLTAYQGTPLGRSVFGPSENIQKINKDDIAFYHRNNIIAPRMVLCGVGNVHHHELAQLAEKHFSKAPNTYTGEIPVVSPCRFTGSDVRARDDWLPFAHVAIAVNTCGLDSPDIYSLMLAKTHIGSWDKTFASSSDTFNTLVQHIHKAKGCHSYEAFHTLYRDTGLWGCYFVMDKMLLDDFVYNLQDEWMKLCVNVTASELEVAKNMLRSNLLLALENPVNSCTDIARQVLFLGEHTSFSEIEEKISNITLQKFRDTCSKYIYDRCPAVAAVGPIEGLTDYTRVRGGMYWLRF